MTQIYIPNILVPAFIFPKDNSFALSVACESNADNEIAASSSFSDLDYIS